MLWDGKQVEETLDTNERTVRNGRSGSKGLHRILIAKYWSELDFEELFNIDHRTEHDISSAHENDVEIVGSSNMDGPIQNMSVIKPIGDSAHDKGKDHYVDKRSRSVKKG